MFLSSLLRVPCVPRCPPTFSSLQALQGLSGSLNGPGACTTGLGWWDSAKQPPRSSVGGLVGQGEWIWLHRTRSRDSIWVYLENRFCWPAFVCAWILHPHAFGWGVLSAPIAGLAHFKDTHVQIHWYSATVKNQIVNIWYEAPKCIVIPRVENLLDIIA